MIKLVRLKDTILGRIEPEDARVPCGSMRRKKIGVRATLNDLSSKLQVIVAKKPYARVPIKTARSARSALMVNL